MRALTLFLANLFGLVLAVVITFLIAKQLGSGEIADTFILARRIVTGLSELLHQAALLLLIPMLAVASQPFGKSNIGRLLCISVALYGLCWLAVPLVVTQIARSASDIQIGEITQITRIMLLAIPVAILFSYLNAVSNLEGKFAVPALLKALPRLCLILVFVGAIGQLSLRNLAWGFSTGNLLMLLALGCLVFWRRPANKVTENSTLAQSSKFVIPILIVVASAQLAQFLESYYAIGLGEGQLTRLEFSQRAMALVGNTLGLSLAMPVLATWSQTASNRTPENFWHFVWIGLGAVLLVQGFFAVNQNNILSLVYGSAGISESVFYDLQDVSKYVLASPIATLLFRIALIWSITHEQSDWKIIALACLTDLALRVICGAVLAPVIGLSGVAVGMTIAPLMAAAVLILPQNRILNAKILPQGDQLKFLVTVVLTILTMILGTFAFDSFVQTQQSVSQFGSILVSGVFGGLVLAFLIYKWRLINALKR